MSDIYDLNEHEKDNENSIRPLYLNDFIGQDNVKEQLQIYIGAAKHRKEVLDHVLLYGPPGLGKTTLANIIANELGSKIKMVSGPGIEKVKDLALILNELKEGDVLFIDEIHRLPHVVEEILYTAMEDYVLSVILDNDSYGKTVEINLPPFTLVGATTRAGDLTRPLLSRFGIQLKLSYYTENDISQIVKRTSKVLKTDIDEESSKMISQRSRGTPRLGNRIFKRIRDYVNFQNRDIITIEDTKNALMRLRLNEIGLEDIEIRYLTTLYTRFNCGPVGLEMLSNAIGEEMSNVQDVCEPYLILKGFIDRTIKGRILTQIGKNYVKDHILM